MRRPVETWRGHPLPRVGMSDAEEHDFVEPDDGPDADEPEDEDPDA